MIVRICVLDLMYVLDVFLCPYSIKLIGMLLIGPWATNYDLIKLDIKKFSYKKMQNIWKYHLPNISHFVLAYMCSIMQALSLHKPKWPVASVIFRPREWSYNIAIAMAIDWNLLRRRKLFQLSQCTCYSIGSVVNGIVQLTVWENVITRHIDSEEMFVIIIHNRTHTGFVYFIEFL